MIKLGSAILMLMLTVSLMACGGSSHSGSGDTGATLTGTVESFTASLTPKKKSIFMAAKEFFPDEGR